MRLTRALNRRITLRGDYCRGALGVKIRKTGAGAHSIRLIRPSKGVLSAPGMDSACRSNASTRKGNCREAAKPVPSMPGRYTIRGSVDWSTRVDLPGINGLMKRGGPPVQ